MISLAWTAMLALPTHAQVAPPAQPPATRTPAAGAPAATEPEPELDPTNYRLVERYSTEVDPKAVKPGEFSQYRVGCRDVIRVMTEKPQGTPDRIERSIQVIYSERPVAVNASGIVTDSVRRYEAFRDSASPAAAIPGASRPLDGLSIWLKSQRNATSSLLSLTPNHSLSEVEYAISRRLVYLPELAGILPPTLTRVGQRWRVPRPAARALFGEEPVAGDGLAAMLREVKPAAKGNEMVALIDVGGSAELGPLRVLYSLNAQITFTFTKAPSTAAAPVSTPPVVDGVGAITELRLSRVSNSLVPGGTGRLKSTVTWEMVLQRQTAPGASSAPIAVPTPAPVPTHANSWIVYNDPKSRFHFRHPQDLLPLPGLTLDEGVQLYNDSTNGDDVRRLTIRLQPKTGNPAEDKASTDFDTHVRELKDDWQKARRKGKIDKEGPLPEADWAASKMKVYRAEATVKPPLTSDGRVEPPIFFDHYLILFTQPESLAVDAITGQTKPEPFRKQVEEILKTFKLGPYKPAA